MAGNRYEKAAFARALERVEVPGRARQTGLVLAHWMNADGTARIGHRRLADEWGIGRKRLTADLRALEKAGVLQVLTRAAEHGTNRYRSLARFVGESADIVLEDGTLLPARSSGDALERAARSSGDALASDQPPARSSGDALHVEPLKVPARSFETPARSFEPPARSSGDANHLSTPPPIGGGGAADAATSAIATVATPWEIDEALTLATKKLPELDTNNERLRTIVAERLAGGWTPERLIAAAFKRRLPKEIHSADGFLLQRLSAVSCAPPVESAVTPHQAPSQSTSSSDKALRSGWEMMAIFCMNAGYWTDEMEAKGSGKLHELRRLYLDRPDDFSEEEWREEWVMNVDWPLTDRTTCIEDLRLTMFEVTTLLEELVVRRADIEERVHNIYRAIYVAGWDELCEIGDRLLEIEAAGPMREIDGRLQLPDAKAVMSLKIFLGRMDVPTERELDEAEPNDTQLTRCTHCGRRWLCEHRPAPRPAPLSSNHN